MPVHNDKKIERGRLIGRPLSIYFQEPEIDANKYHHQNVAVKQKLFNQI